MKLLLTTSELVELGNVAVRAHHTAGVVLQGMNIKLDAATLVKTDRELLEEAAQDAIKDIEAAGGSVKRNNSGDYIVELPESFTIEAFKVMNSTMKLSTPFIVKAFNFGNKYKGVFQKLFSYIRSIAHTFGPIFEAGEAKDIQKDFDELEDEFLKLKANCNRASKEIELNQRVVELSIAHTVLVEELQERVNIQAMLQGAVNLDPVVKRSLQDKCYKHCRLAKNLERHGALEKGIYEGIIEHIDYLLSQIK